TKTTLSELFKRRVDLAPPQVEVVNFRAGPPQMPDFSMSSVFLRIGFHLKIGDISETEMIQLQPIAFAKAMATELAAPPKQPAKKTGPTPASTGIPTQSPGMQQGMQGMGMPQGMQQGNQGMGMPQGMQQGMQGMGVPQGMQPGMQGMGMPQGMHQGMQGMGMPQGMQQGNQGMPQMQWPGMGMQGMGMPIQGNPADFGMLQMPMGGGLQSNIDLLLDVPLQITVELGRTRKLLKDVLELGIGSVVELDKLAGEAVEVLVNNKLIAKGEVVVIDENFAVRITSIVNPQDRLQAI
ncbi:MAG: flagellar motor switch protein FliN, partial [Candidatus Ozemobacteraceae bacterium]